MAEIDEWVAKAEADWSVATSLSRRRRVPLYDAVCFHCQQCAEKYLKAFLVLHRVLPPKIHDVVELIDRCSGFDPRLAALADYARPLNAYAVKARYPGAFCSPDDAKDARARARNLRRVVRKALGL